MKKSVESLLVLLFVMMLSGCATTTESVESLNGNNNESEALSDENSTLKEENNNNYENDENDENDKNDKNDENNENGENSEIGTTKQEGKEELVQYEVYYCKMDQVAEKGVAAKEKYYYKMVYTYDKDGNVIERKLIPAKNRPSTNFDSIVLEFISLTFIPPEVTIASSTGLYLFTVNDKFFNK